MRPSWDVYFMQIARLAASRGTCDRRKVGCVIISAERHVIATGFNGSLSGTPHCSEVGHFMVNGSCVRTVHAEANAIAQAASGGRATAGATAYVTTHPCPTCALLLISAGIKRIVYGEAYHADKDDVTSKLLEGTGIEMRFMDFI